MKLPLLRGELLSGVPAAKQWMSGVHLLKFPDDMILSSQPVLAKWKKKKKKLHSSSVPGVLRWNEPCLSRVITNRSRGENCGMHEIKKKCGPAFNWIGADICANRCSECGMKWREKKHIRCVTINRRCASYSRVLLWAGRLKCVSKDRWRQNRIHKRRPLFWNKKFPFVMKMNIMYTLNCIYTQSHFAVPASSPLAALLSFLLRFKI